MPEDSKVSINYTVRFSDDGGISQCTIAKFQLNNSSPTLEWNWPYLILERPQVKIDSNLENIANNFKLNQNYPNPFNSQTKIKYSIPLEDKVKLQVYDIQGKLVKTLVNENQGAGEYTIPLDASALSSGIYFYRIQTSKGSQTKKMSVLK